MMILTVPAAQKRRIKQIVYVLTPLAGLLSCLGFINLVPPWLNRPPEPAATPSSAVIDVETETAAPPTQLPTPIMTATAVPSPPPSPTLPPDVRIELLGPPPDSSFRQEDAISFYWDWPLAVAEDQQLAVYVRQNEQETLLSAVAEPNLGARYRVRVDAASLAQMAGPIEWFVRLQSELTPPSVLVQSDTRTLNILP